MCKCKKQLRGAHGGCEPRIVVIVQKGKNKFGGRGTWSGGWGIVGCEKPKI